MAEALASAHTTRRLHVTELDDLDDSVRFDASILPISILAVSRSALGDARLGAILVVADRGDEHGRVTAFASGAADCIAPDIPAAELRARLAGILRRRAGAPPGSHGAGKQGGYWYLNLTRHYLVSPHGERIELPGSTFEIFLALAGRPRRVLSRPFLVSALGSGKRTSSRNIDVIITRLRQTLERYDPSGPSLIATVRNEGYQLARDIQRDEHGITILDA